MYGFAKRQSTPDWRFVALKTKRGLSGRSCSVARSNRCFRYAAAIFSPIVTPGVIRPSAIAGKSIVFPASLRSGSTTSAWKPWATPRSSKASFGQASPSTPAVIEPPETLDTRSSLGR